MATALWTKPNTWPVSEACERAPQRKQERLFVAQCFYWLYSRGSVGGDANALKPHLVKSFKVSNGPKAPPERTDKAPRGLGALLLLVGESDFRYTACRSFLL